MTFTFHAQSGDQMEKQVKLAQKTAILGVPFCILFILFMFWVVIDGLLPDIQDLLTLAPVVQITPGTPVVFTGILMMFIIVVLSIFSAIPWKEQTFKKIGGILRYIFNLILIINGITALISLFIITPLQYYAMPKLGYTRCGILEGEPNKYSTNWVKNPAWCVRGKSHEWIKEQARMAAVLQPSR